MVCCNFTVIKSKRNAIAIVRSIEKCKSKSNGNMHDKNLTYL